MTPKSEARTLPLERASRANRTRKDGLLWPRRNLVTVERSSPMASPRALSVKSSSSMNSASVMPIRVPRTRRHVKWIVLLVHEAFGSNGLG